MIVATWNVNSINARLEHIEQFLDNYQPDILCMQETKTVDEKFPRNVFLERDYELEIYGERSYNGVAIASRLPMSESAKGFKTEVGPGSKRLLGAKCGDFHVLNLYIPNGQEVGSQKYSYKLEWLAALKSHIEDNYKPDDNLIVCGDFNIATEDRDVFNAAKYGNSIMCSLEERRLLEDIRKWGFVDIFREKHQDGGLFTWWAYLGGSFRRNLGFRIDHIWTTQSLVEACSAVMIAREVRELTKPSDHAPVIAEFE